MTRKGCDVVDMVNLSGDNVKFGGHIPSDAITHHIRGAVNDLLLCYSTVYEALLVRFRCRTLKPLWFSWYAL